MQIHEKKLQNKSKKEIYVIYVIKCHCLQDRHRPTSKKLHTPY